MTKTGLLGIGVVAVLAFTALVSACGGDDNGNGDATGVTNGGTSPPASDVSGGDTVTVVTNAFDYAPEQLTATAGEELTVEYENNDTAPHTFTIDGVVDSDMVAAGESSTVSFTPSAGTYTFYCTIHGEDAMSGTLEVS